MSQPYVGEIRMFAGTFAPVGWALCTGGLLPISDNDVLFQVIGTTYGGDGIETFGLPDLSGRLPVHQGTGPSLGRTFTMGEAAGAETVQLSVQQLPRHGHPIAAAATATTPSASGNYLAGWADVPFSTDTPTAQLGTALNPAGGDQAHDNMPPYLAINYIISLYGLFPSQT